MIALHGTAYHVERLVQGYRRAQEAQELSREAQQHTNRSVSYGYAEDGSLDFEGPPAGRGGRVLIKALEAALERLPETEISADVVEERPIPYACAARRCARRRGGELPRRVRHRVLDHAPIAIRSSCTSTPRLCTSTAAGRCELEQGPSLAVETVRRLACDASLLRVLENEHGEPLDVGRKTRSIPPAIRRALRSRDAGCRFPGCTHQRYVDAHHIEHWADGGETKLSNLVTLCRSAPSPGARGRDPDRDHAHRRLVLRAPGRTALRDDPPHGRPTTRTIWRPRTRLSAFTSTATPQPRAGAASAWTTTSACGCYASRPSAPARNMTLPRKRPKVLSAQPRRPESTPADTIQKLGKFDAGRLRSLRQETGRSHAGQRVCLQAPESTGGIATEVGAAVSAEFQHLMHASRVILQQRGLNRRNFSGKRFTRAARLVLGLIVEDLARRNDFPNRESGAVQHAHSELAPGNEALHHDFVIEAQRLSDCVRQLRRCAHHCQTHRRSRLLGFTTTGQPSAAPTSWPVHGAISQSGVGTPAERNSRLLRSLSIAAALAM